MVFTECSSLCRDEGFHLLVVGAWDNDLSLDILKSWIGLIDEDGWVAREQILGEEARSKVCTPLPQRYVLFRLTSTSQGSFRVPDSVPFIRESSDASYGSNSLHQSIEAIRNLHLFPRSHLLFQFLFSFLYPPFRSSLFSARRRCSPRPFLPHFHLSQTQIALRMVYPDSTRPSTRMGTRSSIEETCLQVERKDRRSCLDEWTG